MKTTTPYPKSTYIQGQLIVQLRRKKHGFSATNVQLMLKILASAPLCSAPNILPRCKMSLRTHARRSSETGTFLSIFYNPCIYFLPIYYNPCIYFLSIFYNPCTYFLSIFYTFFSTCIYFLYWGGWWKGRKGLWSWWQVRWLADLVLNAPDHCGHIHNTWLDKLVVSVL